MCVCVCVCVFVYVCVCVCVRAGEGTLSEPKVKQLFKMAKDCLERGEDIFTTARKEQRPLALFQLATPSPTVSPTLSTPPLPPPNSSRSLLHSNTHSGLPNPLLPSPKFLHSSPNAGLTQSQKSEPSNPSTSHSRLMSWPSLQKPNLRPRRSSKAHGADVGLPQQQLQTTGMPQPLGHTGKGGAGPILATPNNLTQSQPKYVHVRV